MTAFLVIPAKAGIPLYFQPQKEKRDPRFREGDELRGSL